MPERPRRRGCGERMTGASGNEHWGRSSLLQWRDSRCPCVTWELSDITGLDCMRTSASPPVNSYSFSRQTIQLRMKSEKWFAFGVSMTSPAETAMTFAIVKSAVIVGTALATVLVLALVGAKRR